MRGENKRGRGKWLLEKQQQQQERRDDQSVKSKRTSRRPSCVLSCAWCTSCRDDDEPTPASRAAHASCASCDARGARDAWDSCGACAPPSIPGSRCPSAPSSLASSVSWSRASRSWSSLPGVRDQLFPYPCDLRLDVPRRKSVQRDSETLLYRFPRLPADRLLHTRAQTCCCWWRVRTGLRTSVGGTWCFRFAARSNWMIRMDVIVLERSLDLFIFVLLFQ